LAYGQVGVRPGWRTARSAYEGRGASRLYGASRTWELHYPVATYDLSARTPTARAAGPLSLGGPMNGDAQLRDWFIRGCGGSPGTPNRSPPATAPVATWDR
jgi:hypothetical protein